MTLTTEDRIRIRPLPLRERRAALSAYKCEICKTKPAQNVLEHSHTLCCMIRGDRCRGNPSEGDVCYYCGNPATTKTKVGMVCGSSKLFGCNQKELDFRKNHSDTLQKNFSSAEFKSRFHAKTTKTLEERYGSGIMNVYQIPEVRKKAEETCLERYGVKNPANSEELLEKGRQTSIRNRGVAYHSQLDDEKDNLVNSIRAKYGVDSIVQDSGWREQYKAKVGVDHPCKLESTKTTIRKTHRLRYGCDHYSQTTESKLRLLATIKARYGVTNMINIPGALDKRVTSYMDRYGAPNPMQSPSFFREFSIKMRRTKYATLPSGREIYYQGYELPAILRRVSEFGEDDILFNGELSIPYNDNGVSRVYYPDIAVRSTKTLIEVKSQYTFNKGLEASVMLSKLVAASSLGWKPIVEIWDNASADAPLETLNLEEVLVRVGIKI